jgi:hypothetical protein
LILQFLAKFRNPMVIIILAASALSAFTGDAASFFIISTIVLISVTLDFVQEYQAGQAAERLRQSVAVRGQVLREGKALEIPLTEMVPGDVALLGAGNLVPYQKEEHDGSRSAGHRICLFKEQSFIHPTFPAVPSSAGNSRLSSPPPGQRAED